MQCSWEMRGQVPFFHVLRSAVYTCGEERGGELLFGFYGPGEKKGALTLALEVVYSTLYRVLE